MNSTKKKSRIFSKSLFLTSDINDAFITSDKNINGNCIGKMTDGTFFCNFEPLCSEPQNCFAAVCKDSVEITTFFLSLVCTYEFFRP